MTASNFKISPNCNTSTFLQRHYKDSNLTDAFKNESKGLKDAINKLNRLSKKKDILESELEAIEEVMQHIQKRYRLVLNMQKLLELSEELK